MSVGARRYRPRFPLWSIWTAFSPVPSTAVYGQAAVDVVAPGGTQHVEWRDDGIYLTGWAAVILEGRWLVEPGESQR